MSSSLYSSQNDKTQYDYALKPREEQDYTEIYPDLDATGQLPVFVIKEDEDDVYSQSNHHSNNFVNFSELKAPIFRQIQQPQVNPNIKFNKQLLDYGFQEPNKLPKTVGNNYNRPFQLTNTKDESIEKLIDKKRNLVEYDMDEQDYLYLKERNEKRENVIKITPEVFEIMITTLENEWDKLEHQMNSIISNTTKQLQTTTNDHKLLKMSHNNHKYGNDDGIVPGSIYDQKCAICNDSDCDNANAIVFCDGCDIAVHQECYGVAFIPEGQWLCRKCMINKNRTTECVFCPSTTGAFKQLDNSLWSHVICAIWINELYFANPTYMEPIEGIENIPKSRWKLQCYICKQKVGACIQCTNRNCFQAYHVSCAKRAGLYMSYTQGIKAGINNKATLKTFCDKHGQNEVPDGIDKVRLYFRDTKLLDEQNARLSRNQKTANKLNIFRWKTETNTPIPPKLFSDKLIDILYKLKVENQISLPEESTNQVVDLNVLPNRSKQEINDEMTEICNDICRYWCLKRELKRGAPLIRKNNNLISTSSILYDSNFLENGISSDEDKLKEKLDFANLLLNDLNKLTNINENVLNRQIINDESNDVNFDNLDMIYFPTKRMIEDLLNKLSGKHDVNETFQNFKPKAGDLKFSCLKDIMNYNLSYGYKSIVEFQKDIEKLTSQIFKENKATNPTYKKVKNWLRDYNKEIVKIKQLLNKENNTFTHYTLDAKIEVPEEDSEDLSDIEIDETKEDIKILENFLNN
ncbi:unnamed protein product [Candida verbasci]|uniref:Uncharacterized protein n=1 Tax=Candida verbasci TaxID=1227364 RepID=A0A9W4XAR9_9ASCO|nr:unnamed protein product [Candida verbasci]